MLSTYRNPSCSCLPPSRVQLLIFQVSHYRIPELTTLEPSNWIWQMKEHCIDVWMNCQEVRDGLMFSVWLQWVRTEGYPTARQGLQGMSRLYRQSDPSLFPPEHITYLHPRRHKSLNTWWITLRNKETQPPMAWKPKPLMSYQMLGNQSQMDAFTVLESLNVLSGMGVV